MSKPKPNCPFQSALRNAGVTVPAFETVKHVDKKMLVLIAAKPAEWHGAEIRPLPTGILPNTLELQINEYEDNEGERLGIHLASSKTFYGTESVNKALRPFGLRV